MKLKCIYCDKESNKFKEGKEYIVIKNDGVFYKILGEDNKIHNVPLNGFTWGFEIVKENEMNKEKLQEIASTMTEEEFKNKYIVMDCGGDEILNIGGKEFVCPDAIGLRSILSNPTGCCRDCKKCWENAIKELKFKEDNMKELNIIEASKIQNGEFEVIYPSGNKRSKKLKTDLNGNLYNDDNTPFENAYFHDIIQSKFIPLPKEKKVDFMEAAKAFSEGKKIKSVWENSEYYYNGKQEVKLVDETGEPVHAEEISKAKWYIIND